LFKFKEDEHLKIMRDAQETVEMIATWLKKDLKQPLQSKMGGAYDPLASGERFRRVAERLAKNESTADSEGSAGDVARSAIAASAMGGGGGAV